MVQNKAIILIGVQDHRLQMTTEQETLVSNGNLEAIMTALAAMSLDHDQILKQNEEPNLRLHDLEKQMYNAIGQVHAVEVSPPALL